MLATQAQQRNQRLDSQSVAILIGQPGVLVQMLVALIAIGGTALLLYFWRLPATVDERHHARLALRRMSTWNCIVGVAVLTFFSVPYLDCLLENWEFLLSLVTRH